MNKLLSVLIIGLLLAGCVSTSIIAHDEKKAAKAAERFATAAFLKRDYSDAYDLLSIDTKNRVSLVQFQETIIKMHPAGFPSAIKPVEFEPIPGQKAMNIFLVGQEGSESFYYRLVMEGTSHSGYQVAGIFRGNGPYPSSKLRKKL
jgi:hypothetical protein